MNWVAFGRSQGFGIDWRRPWLRVLSISLVSVGVFSACTADPDSQGGGGGAGEGRAQGLEIWWSEGYYPEETEAIRQAVNSWSEETGTDVQLSFFSEKDLLQQTERAIVTGDFPDIIYGYELEFSILPRLAWEGKLSPTEEILNPVASLYSDAALESVNYANSETGERAYYAVPISQQTIHIHYWQPLLEQAGLSATDIPREWDAFWDFWVSTQDRLQQATGNDSLYGLGLPMSIAATDTNYTFEQFLVAYGVTLVAPDGTLQVEQPEVRSAIITALEDYTRHYQDGHVPANATEWGDPDNNVTFLSRLTVMTPNPTMSIPGSQRQDPVVYQDQLATTLWPNRPNGEPMVYLASVKQVAIFANSDHLEDAQSLVSHLIQPEILGRYIEGAQGRFFPVMPQLLEGNFWSDESDPHTQIAAQQFSQVVPLPTVYNPAYSQVQAERVWGQAIRSIVVDGVPPEEAADTAIAAIRQIFMDW